MNKPEQKDITIPGDHIESVRIILDDCARSIAGLAEYAEKNSASDYNVKIMAMISKDHIKKLVWVYDLISNEPTMPNNIIARNKLNNPR